MSKAYRLKKDLPTFKAGEIFDISLVGDLVKRSECLSDCIVAYSAQTLAKFPNILKDWFEEILEEPKTVWDLGYGDECYHIYANGSIASDTWCNTLLDYVRREVGNAFLTEEEAEKEVARRKAKQVLLKDTKGFKPDIYNLDQVRSYVAYDPVACEIYTNRERFDDYSHEIIFKSHKDAEASIKAHEKEWKIYLGVSESGKNE